MESVNEAIRKRVNIREIYRYLGYGINTPDEGIEAIVDEVLENLIKVVKPKNIYKIFKCTTDGGEIALESIDNENDILVIKSKNLSDNLSQCSKVILLAATLGLEADKLMQKYEILNMAKASISQACGAACIEAYCNILQDKIHGQLSDEEYMATGNKLYLRPRFSPGYGDLPLQYQRIIFDELECTKRIGLTLTESLLMYPTKSVTAFIGLTNNPKSCHIHKCKNCENIGCEFRDE
jgi:cobalamin-dependent methionine synthase I